MPPQQANLTSEPRRDAAGLRLDCASALAKDAMVDATVDALAVARPDASIASLRDAVSEKQAAGPPAKPARGVLSLLQRCWQAFLQRRQRERLRASLQELSDRELTDIGLTSAEIDYIVAHRALERLRDGTAHLWLSRGAM